MVSGCERVLFMASKWNGAALVEEFHCWYTPDMDLRAQIVAGWKQLATDLATYEPAPIAPVVVAEAMKSLPAVSVRLDGKLAVVSNLPDFSTALRAFIAHIPKLPDTDQEFANAESACKALKRAEDALTAGEASALAEMTDFEAMRRTVRDLKELARTTRLATEKLVAARKEQLRREIVAGGVSVLREHVEVLNTRLDKPYMPQVDADIGGAIRGKKNLNSMRDAVSVEVARAKIEASEIAARIQINLDTMLRLAGSYTGMFPDATTLVLKQPDDFEAQVQARVTRRKEEDQARFDAGRERIRAQEQAKAQPEADENVAAAARTAVASSVPAEAKYPRGGHTTYPAPTTAQFSGREWAAQPAGDRELPHHQVYGSSPVPTANVVPMRTTAPIARTTPPSLKLGQLAERLGFTLTADFLRTIGFEPAAKERGATLYHDVDFSLICAALVKHINQVQALKAA